MRRESDSPYPHKNVKPERLAPVLHFCAGRENRKTEAVYKINFMERSEIKFRLVAESGEEVLNKNESIGRNFCLET